jgi:hypothetical protein
MLNYDYDIQAWIEHGKILKCGHKSQMHGCTACMHAGRPQNTVRALMNYKPITEAQQVKSAGRY